jgi:hypothetical protein
MRPRTAVRPFLLERFLTLLPPLAPIIPKTINMVLPDAAQKIEQARALLEEARSLVEEKNDANEVSYPSKSSQILLIMSRKSCRS